MRTSVLCVVSILTMAAVACSSDPEQRTLPTEDDSDDERRDSGFTQPGRSSSSSGESPGSSSGETPGSSSGESPGSSSGETPGSSSGNQSSSGAASFMPPVCDGVVAAGEYGSMDHSVTTATLQTWSVTWDLENLYLAVENATLSEGALLYLDTSGGGSTAGAIYDNQAPNLPFGAELVIYAKQGYRNYRLASGATTWADPVENTGIEVCVGASDTREIVVPWSLVGGRPASFGFLGYLTSTGGSVYGTLPENPDQVIGELTTSFAGYYRVSDATVVTPFADRQGD